MNDDEAQVLFGNVIPLMKSRVCVVNFNARLDVFLKMFENAGIRYNAVDGVPDRVLAKGDDGDVALYPFVLQDHTEEECKRLLGCTKAPRAIILDDSGSWGPGSFHRTQSTLFRLIQYGGYSVSGQSEFRFEDARIKMTWGDRA